MGGGFGGNAQPSTQVASSGNSFFAASPGVGNSGDGGSGAKKARRSTQSGSRSSGGFSGSNSLGGGLDGMTPLSGGPLPRPSNSNSTTTNSNPTSAGGAQVGTTTTTTSNASSASFLGGRFGGNAQPSTQVAFSANSFFAASPGVGSSGDGGSGAKKARRSTQSGSRPSGGFSGSNSLGNPETTAGVFYFQNVTGGGTAEPVRIPPPSNKSRQIRPRPPPHGRK